MAAFKRMNQLSLPMFNIRDLDLELEDINVPYYFVVDGSMVIQDILVPNKYYPNISESYIEYVKKLFVYPQ